jgi:uncharacterized protein (TIGR02099 family)
VKLGTIFRFLETCLLVLLVVVSLVVLAYWSAGYYFLPRLSHYQTTIQSTLADKVKGSVTIGRLQGSWHGFSPRVEIDQIEIVSQQPSVLERFRADRVELYLNVPASLWQGQLVFNKLTLSKPELWLDYQPTSWQALVANSKKAAGTQDSTGMIELTRRLLNQKQLAINQGTLHISTSTALAKYQQTISDINLHYSRQANGGYWLQGQAQLKATPQTAGSQLRVRLVGQDATDGWPDLKGSFYFKLTPTDLMPYMPQGIIGQQLQLQHLQLGGELWGRLSQGRLQQLQGHLAVNKLLLAKQDVSLPAIDGHSQFAWQRQAGSHHWQLFISDLAVNGQQSLVNQGFLRISHNAKGYNAALNQLDISSLTGFVQQLQLLSPTQSKPLELLAPKGQLSRIELTGFVPGDYSKLQLSADIKQLSWQPWQKVPGLNHLNGQLSMTPESGHLAFFGKQMSLNYQQLFRAPLSIEQAAGALNWQSTPTAWLVKTTNLKLANEDTRGRAEVFLRLPKVNQGMGLVQVAAGIEQANAAATDKYLPVKRMSDDLVKWLDRAIKKGQVKDGGFLYSEQLNLNDENFKQRQQAAEEKDDDVFQMYFNVRQATLNYDPHWPVISEANLLVYIGDQGLEIPIQSAKLLNSTVSGGLVTLPYKKQPDDLFLRVDAQLTGPLADGLTVLRTSPIKDNLDGALDDWRMAGKMAVDLKLGIPLEDSPRHLMTNVAVQVTDGSLYESHSELTASQLKGTLEYSQDKGINAKELTGQLLGGPVTFKIITRVNKDNQKQQQTRVAMQGTANATDLYQWAKQAVLQQLSGNLPYQADFYLGNEGRHRLVLNSNLKGLAVNLPAPVGKTANQQRNFNLELRFGQHGQIINFNDGNRIAGILAIRSGQFVRGRINFGRARLSLPKQPGLWISGRLTKLVLNDWLALFDKLKSAEVSGGSKAAGDNAADKIRLVELKIDQLDAFGQTIKNVTGRISRGVRQWLIQLTSQRLAGKLILPDNKQQPMQADLDYINWPALPRPRSSMGPVQVPYKAPELVPRADPLADFAPQSLPALQLKVKQLTYGGKPFGSWQLVLVPERRGVNIKQLTGDMRGIKVSVTGQWYQDRRGKIHSQFTGQLASQDLAKMLKAWDYAASMTGSAQLNFDLSWPGSPAAFSLAKIKGVMDLKAEDGRFLDIDSGAIRMLGILNFQTILRRLSFNFSDLFKEGLAYDEINSSLQVANGLLQTRKALTIKGPSASFKISGSINLINQQLDQDLVATLPISGSLPAIALIAGNPILGGAVLLFNTILQSPLNRLAQLTYHIGGTLDNPIVQPKVTAQQQANANSKSLASQTK